MSQRVAREPGRSRAYWLSHIEQWKSSGQSKADYCREHHLNSGNFYNWCSQQNVTRNKPQDSPQVKALKFLPVNLHDASDPTATVSIQRAEYTFLLPLNMPAELIERWLSEIGKQLHA